MKAKVSPVAMIVVIVAVLAVIGFIGYKTVLAPPPSVSGIGPDGKPMTQQQIDALKDKMRPK